MIEETLGVIQRGAPGECQLYEILVRLAGADQPVVEPHGCPSRLWLPPLPHLDDFKVGLLDQSVEAG